MQKIIDFIIRKKDFVVYFILLSFSLVLTFNTNFYQKSKFIVFLNSIANDSKETLNKLNGYFVLKKINSDLIQENLFLKNKLEGVSKNANSDSIHNTTFYYQNAKVISNNLSYLKNYLVIDKGIKNGLSKEMGVISSTGIVGIINHSSLNYSSVMSVLNIETKINAKVKRSSYFGTLEWDGSSSEHLLLNDIPETADVKIGDSIITGGMSLIFPEGINIGVVSNLINQNKLTDDAYKTISENQKKKYLDLNFRENYLNIEVKLHTNLGSLNNVYVIESLNKVEFEKIKK
ncbi:MAG: hypothetical protein CMD12_03545 [Flavobacteriales bacterium]|nr:hypothetical protein [Flavobacteriales bacterium]